MSEVPSARLHQQSVDTKQTSIPHQIKVIHLFLANQFRIVSLLFNHTQGYTAPTDSVSNTEPNSISSDQPDSIRVTTKNHATAANKPSHPHSNNNNSLSNNNNKNNQNSNHNNHSSTNVNSNNHNLNHSTLNNNIGKHNNLSIHM